MRILEVAVDSYEGALAAQEAGAQRVELNVALSLGGITPSLGLVRQCVETLSIQVVPMLRPRGAGFCYSPLEFDTMMEDLSALIALPIQGVAFGFLTEDFEVDEARSLRVVSALHERGMEAVFHRAFDNARSMDEAAEALIRCGVDRLLSSGQAPDAYLGRMALAHLQETYGKELEIMPGCGVRPSNAKAILEASKVFQLHSSCKSYQDDKTTVSKVSYSLKEGPSEGAYPTVVKADVLAMLKAMED